MKTPSPEITKEEWDKSQYPYDAFITFQTSTERPDIAGRSGERIAILREIEGVRTINPTKLFTDPREQREHLIDIILELFKDDETRTAVSINFGTLLSESEHHRLWPDWKLPTRPITGTEKVVTMTAWVEQYLQPLRDELDAGGPRKGFWDSFDGFDGWVDDGIHDCMKITGGEISSWQCVALIDEFIQVAKELRSRHYAKAGGGGQS